MQTSQGNVIEILYTLDKPTTPGVTRNEWHARIVGERLANCGLDLATAFSRKPELDEPDLTQGDRCHGCALVLYNVRMM